MDLSRKITLNTLAQILGRAGVILISLLTTVYLTRGLGQAGYGAFGVISAAVVIFFSLGDWGTNFIAVREASKSKYEPGLVLGNSLIIRSLMSLIGIVLYILFIYLNPAFLEYRTAAYLSSLTIFFLSLKTSVQIIFHSQLKLHLSSLVDLFSSILFFIFLIVFGSELSLILTVWSLIFSAGLAALLALVIVFRFTKVNFKLDRSFLCQWLKESIPMGFLLASYSIYSRIDTFILHSIKGESAVGIYILAYKVHDNLVLGAAYLMNSFFPVISGYSSADKGKLKNIIQSAFSLLIVMAVPLVIIFFVSAPWIINLLGGTAFGDSVMVLRILIFATGFAYLNHLTGYSLTALGKQRVHLKFSLILLVVNFSLNLMFIPRYSYMAAAAVAVLSQAIIFILTYFYLKYKMHLQLRFDQFPETVKQIIFNKGKFF